jgi:hypothetical protein
LQLLFECKDEEENVLEIGSMTSVRVSSLLLAAPMSTVDPIWCCKENDLVASVTQDVHSNSFTASAFVFSSGINFIVPAVLSAGASASILTCNAFP